MKLAARTGPVCVAVCGGLLAGPAAAAPKPITGKLSKPGYTVIALSDEGRGSVRRAERGSFRLRPPARTVTLHLRAPNGVYAGPIVVRSARRRAILGVRAGARLGLIRVRRGHARPARRLRSKWLDGSHRARARRGVPIGAGRFGRVRSLHVRGAPPGDADLDGIPDVLDVDDDGDRILDKVDRPRTRRSAQVAQEPEERFDFHSRLTLTLDQTANANASGLTDDQMDAALAGGGDLLFTILRSDSSQDSPELDCGGSIQQPPRPEGLVYCRPHASGGIGRLVSLGPAFPDCCDSDEDGLGTIIQTGAPVTGAPLGSMTLHHGAATEQIGTGDLMIQRVLRNGAEVSFLGALQYVFASVPAVASYQGETGATVTVPYPYPPATDPDGGGPLPTIPAPLTVADGPDADGDVEVTLTFWRPQRSVVPAWGETGDWVDIGGLRYEVQVEFSGRRCPQNAFSEDDSELALHSSSPIYADFAPGFTDLGPDRAADPNNTVTYTLNLSRCLESNGFTFNAGDIRGFSFLAVNPTGPDNGQQGVWFKRE